MKFKIVIIFIALIFFITQPVNISMADKEGKSKEERIKEVEDEVKKLSSTSQLRLCSEIPYGQRWINCLGGIYTKFKAGGYLRYIGEYGPNIGVTASNEIMDGFGKGYFHGNGTLSVYDTDVSIKDWIKKNVFPDEDIIKYVGEFEYGYMNGQGIMYFKDGSRYEGAIKDRLFNGDGKLVDSDGNILKEGIWKSGNLIQSKKIELTEGKQLKNCNMVQDLFVKNVNDKTKTLGGYKHIYFGMSREDVYQIIDCKKLNIFDRDEFDGNAGIGTRGIVLKELYKYPLGVIFKKNEIGPGSTVDKLSLEVVSTIRTKERYSFGSSGIEQFEELKKALSNKYKLTIKPSETSIDQYNNAAVSGTLNWVFNDNDSKNLIILSLRGVKSKDFINYIYFGEVQYLSPDQSKNYLNKIDGKKIKSDDL